jgi:hypothetical protein
LPIVAKPLKEVKLYIIPTGEKTMEMNTTCPACGAIFYVSGDAHRINCPFCSTSYEADLTGVQPALSIVSPEESVDDPFPTQSAETESAPTPPIVKEPAFSQFQSPPDPIQNWQPPVAAPPPPAQSNLIWILVAVVGLLLVCSVCACFGLFALISNSGQIPIGLH